VYWEVFAALTLLHSICHTRLLINEKQGAVKKEKEEYFGEAMIAISNRIPPSTPLLCLHRITTASMHIPYRYPACFLQNTGSDLPRNDPSCINSCLFHVFFRGRQLLFKAAETLFNVCLHADPGILVGCFELIDLAGGIVFHAIELVNLRTEIRIDVLRRIPGDFIERVKPFGQAVELRSLVAGELRSLFVRVFHGPAAH
jgi:hypothetical protein